MCSVLNRLAFKVLLKDVCISWRDSLVVVLLQVHHLESELFVKFYSTFVAGLDVPKRKIP